MKTLITNFTSLCLLAITSAFAQEPVTQPADTIVPVVTMDTVPPAPKVDSLPSTSPVAPKKDVLGKDVKERDTENRNVMLNASSATTPRQLNIGLPFNGDILILENDIPVVYTFWTQIPTTAWRYDSTIGRIGMMSFQDGALTYGKVGYIVTSWDREPGRKLQGYASTYFTNYGSSHLDASVTAPIGKKGWGFMAGFNETFERGSGGNYQFTPFQDRFEMFKIGVSKKYSKGFVRAYYKHATDIPMLGAYSPFVYEGNGKTKAIDGFDLGRDVYMPNDGLFPYQDYNTGETKLGNLNSDEASKNITNAIYLTGEHRFNNGWKLNYANMYMNSKAAFTILYPLSMFITDPDQQTGMTFKYVGTNKEYKGAVQLNSVQYYPQVEINTWITRLEATKKFDKHSLRLGATYQYYRAPEIQHGGLFYQTVEANPKRLDAYVDMGGGPVNITPQYGILGISYGGYRLTKDHKIAFYASDDIKLNDRFDIGFGARIERAYDRGVRNPYTNQYVQNRTLIDQKFADWNKVGYFNFVAKVSNEFGFLGDITYNDWVGRYWDNEKGETDTSGNPIFATSHNTTQSVLNYGGGVYWNHGELISLVSKVTRIYKKNNIASQSIVNPTNPSEQKTFYPLFYDISTLGWTTDIVSKPFKNFNLHFLLTLQKPEYKDYEYSAYGVSYSYNNKIIPELSKTLIEIDPSYFMLKGDLRLWLSFRYFGNQYGNPTNAISYNGWWESFGGVDYKLNRNIDLKFQVVNILNETGIKGALIGADQILDDKPYIGRKIVAGAIRPRTYELTLNFKF